MNNKQMKKRTTDEKKNKKIIKRIIKLRKVGAIRQGFKKGI